MGCITSISKVQDSPVVTKDAKPLLGIKVSYLVDFIYSSCRGRSNLIGLTTNQVVQKYLVARCVLNESICETLANDPLQKNSVGSPTWYVLHSMENLFLETVDTLIHFLEGREGTSFLNTVIWLNIFSSPLELKSSEEFNFDSFPIDMALAQPDDSSLKQINQVVHVMPKWDDFSFLADGSFQTDHELYSSIGATIEFALTRDGKVSLYEAIYTDCPSFYRHVDEVARPFESCIDGSSASRRAFDAWLLRCIKEILQQYKSSGKLELAADWCRILASIYNNDGLYSLAQTFMSESFDTYERELGKLSQKYIDTGLLLGNLYENEGKFEQAEYFYTSCLQSLETVCGECHVNLIPVLKSFSILLKNRRKMVESIAMFERCINIQSAHYGKESIETLTTIRDFSFALKSFGRVSEAEDMLKSRYTILSNILGSVHPSTMIAMSEFLSVEHQRKTSMMTDVDIEKCLGEIEDESDSD